MEYIYAAMLLHKAGQKVDESSVKKVLEAASVKADAGRIKALIASLDGVDIEEAIANAAVAAPVAAAPAAAGGAPAVEEKKEAKPKEEEKKSDTEAAAGLGSLFG